MTPLNEPEQGQFTPPPSFFRRLPPSEPSPISDPLYALLSSFVLEPQHIGWYPAEWEKEDE